MATTSAGIACSCGVPDGGALDRDSKLEHVGWIVTAVGVPVTSDLEAGQYPCRVLRRKRCLLRLLSRIPGYARAQRGYR
jgi:2-methylisocitrate lyase-like PEP mutase family enzyme